jgi:hypothetical protein
MKIIEQSDSLFTAVVIDRNGVLNAFTLDTTASAQWQGPELIGTASLVPGSDLRVVRVSSTLVQVLLVDRNGVLNVFTLDATSGAGWGGPQLIGSPTLQPGS